FKQNVGPQEPIRQMPPPGNMGGPSADWQWKEFGAQMSAQRFNRGSKGQRRLLAILAVITLVLVVLAGLRYSTLSRVSGDQVTLHIASQQDAVIDLNKSVPI